MTHKNNSKLESLIFMIYLWVILRRSNSDKVHKNKLYFLQFQIGHVDVICHD